MSTPLSFFGDILKVRERGPFRQDVTAQPRIVSAAALRIAEEALNPECSAADLAALAAADPAFALRVLSISNSPGFRRAQVIEDLPKACALLGVRGLRNIALSLVAMDLMPPDGERALANSLRRALAAKSLSEALRLREPDRFFTAGLFLEIGSIVSEAQASVEAAHAPAMHRPTVERATIGEDHTQSGVVVAKHYRLPDATVEAIAKHHDAGCPDGEVPGVCWLAEKIAAVFEGGPAEPLKEAAYAAGEALGASRDVIDAVVASLPKHVTEAAAAFERNVEEQLDYEDLRERASEALAELNVQYDGMVRQLEALLSEKEALQARLIEANETLARQATTDELTGLTNKRGLETALIRDLSRAGRDGSPLSLVVLDIDHFKKFNDTWGHAVGDEVLRVVGQVLQAGVRIGDVPARYGGEEFVVVLPLTGKHGARRVAERLRLDLEAASVKGPKGELKVTASFGIATALSAGDTTPEELFVRADEALYAAKRAGRNRVEIAA
ncbi:MAG: diguanylate cyclase [Myxococcota bacterium]